MTLRLSSSLRLLRFGLWCLPLLTVVGFAVTEHLVSRSAQLEEAKGLLLAGEELAARRVLQKVASSPLFEDQARAGLDILDASSGAAAIDVIASGLEPRAARAYQLAPLVRAQFDRGEFDSAVRLSQLADAVGVSVAAVVAVAAHIEAGEPLDRDTLARAVDDQHDQPKSVLAARVVRHLEQPPAPGTLLLDRHGERIGYVIGDQLQLARGLSSNLVPRALVEQVQALGAAGSVRSSIDLELSRAAAKALGRHRGSIVLVDPADGEILVAVSDRRTFAGGGTPAFEQRREPASISKLVTVAAAQRAGIDPDEAISEMRCRGHRSFSGELLYCASIAGPLRGLDHAMAVSCNVAFAELGVRVGRQGMLDELQRFGFDRHLGDFDGGQIKSLFGDDRQLADLSIGVDESDITPLHGSLMAATLVDGRMPEPTLLRAVDGYLGLHPRLLPAAPTRRVIDSRWLPQLHGAMRAVSRQGTGRRFQARGFPVAMKTGTASDRLTGFHTNYIGFGPLPDVQVAFAVRVTNQPTSRKVRRASSEVTGRLLRSLRRASRQRGWQDSSRYDDPGSQLARLAPSTDTRQPTRSAR